MLLGPGCHFTPICHSYFLLLIYFMVTSLGLVTNITLITQLNSCIFFGSGNICSLASQLCTSILLLDYFSELQTLFHNYRSFIIFVKSRGIFFDFYLRKSYYFQQQAPRPLAVLLVAESSLIVLAIFVIRCASLILEIVFSYLLSINMTWVKLQPLGLIIKSLAI